MTRWSASADGHERRGTAVDPPTAWRLAVDGAMDVVAETGAVVITLVVADETAKLLPALDESGELDGPATREAALLMARVIESGS